LAYVVLIKLMSEEIDIDQRWIKKTIELATKGFGKVSPNPLVGAVVIDRNNYLVAEGYHGESGEDHAEVVALRKADHRAEGGTLYVNLEPCCHHGKTGPCVDLIKAHNLKRVVIGTVDPNPLVNGKSIQILKDSKIEVSCGYLEKECQELNKKFFYWIKKRTPWVTLKVACNFNGKITDPQRRWITGLKAREETHKIRSEFDCILTGSGTVLADDPQMTVRLCEGKNPIRIILDRRLRCNPAQKIFTQPGKSIVFTTDQTEKEKFKSLENTEIMIWNGGLKEAIQILGKKNFSSVLVEAGQELCSSFFNQKLINEVLLFLNPSFSDFSKGLDVYKGKSLNFQIQEIKRLEKDVLFRMDLEELKT